MTSPADTTTQPRPSPEPPAVLREWLLTQLSSRDNADPKSIGLEALQTEASFRQFYRVSGWQSPLVLMDSPPDKEANDQFVAVAQVMLKHGICVPEILAHNKDEGWLLLTDLGRRHFIDLYGEGNAGRCLTAATDTLDQIAAINDPAIPPYTQQRLSDELDIFIEWLVRRACDARLPERLFEPVRNALLANAANQQTVCVHRDFHCKNLLFIAADTDRENTDLRVNTDKVGVLDFQDALMGPNGYDLASLLHDCYWRFDPEVIARVIANSKNTDQHGVEGLAVQRQLKAIGIFARLALRDNKTSHLAHILPVMKNLQSLCRTYPELHALSDWLTETLMPATQKWLARSPQADTDS